MPFNFPASPAPGAVFNDPTTGAQYTFQNGVWMQAMPAQFRLSALPRNRIVNGGFNVSQENGDSGTTASNGYGADQWALGISGITGVGLARARPSPPDPPYTLGIQFGTAKPSLAAGDVGLFLQPIEGSRVADFGWGAAGAKNVILDFKVKATMAGTFAVSLHNSNATITRSWVGSYTIAAGEVGTWVRRTLIIPGDVTGTWAVDSSCGMCLIFGLAIGSTYVGVAGWQAGDKRAGPAMTNGAGVAMATFQYAEVSLYLDPDKTGTPPSWQLPDPADALLLCRRYFALYTTAFVASGVATAAGQNIHASYQFQTAMRIPPATAIFGSPLNANSNGMTFGASGNDGLRGVTTSSAAGAFYAIVGAMTVNARM